MKDTRIPFNSVGELLSWSDVWNFMSTEKNFTTCFCWGSSVLASNHIFVGFENSRSVYYIALFRNEGIFNNAGLITFLLHTLSTFEMSVVILYDPVKRCSEFKDNERFGGIIKPWVSYIHIISTTRPPVLFTPLPGTHTQLWLLDQKAVDHPHWRPPYAW